MGKVRVVEDVYLLIVETLGPASGVTQWLQMSGDYDTVVAI